MRKIVELSKLDWNSESPFSDKSLIEELLKPTKLYVDCVVPLLKKVKINGIVHITGGGILENIPRVLPNGLTASIKLENWDIPEVFRWLSQSCQLTELEMLKTFNCGVGLVLITKQYNEQKVLDFLNDIGENVIPLGNVIKGSKISFSGKLL